LKTDKKVPYLYVEEVPEVEEVERERSNSSDISNSCSPSLSGPHWQRLYL